VSNNTIHDAENIELTELPEKESGASVVGNNKIDLVSGVKVELTAILGKTHISVGELFSLKENNVLSLETNTVEPIDLMLDGNCVARGNLDVDDEQFGIQLTEVAVKG